jgi:hypothetical protein
MNKLLMCGCFSKNKRKLYCPDGCLALGEACDVATG